MQLVLGEARAHGAVLMTVASLLSHEPVRPPVLGGGAVPPTEGPGGEVRVRPDAGRLLITKPAIRTVRDIAKR